MRDRVKDALSDLRRAEAALDRVLKERYPPGGAITWKYKGDFRHGIVLMNCYGDRLKVRNVDTHSEYFIAAYQIFETAA